MTDWPLGTWRGEVGSPVEEEDAVYITKWRVAAPDEVQAEKVMRLGHKCILLGLAGRLPYKYPDLN